jgi:hypothetical protein
LKGAVELMMELWASGTEHLPARRTVLKVEFTDLRAMRHWWLIVQAGEVDVCLDDPG